MVVEEGNEEEELGRAPKPGSPEGWVDDETGTLSEDEGVEAVWI